MSPTFSSDEIAALLLGYDKVLAEPAPKAKRTRTGCLLSFLAIFSMFAFQGFNRAMGLGIPRRTVAIVAFSLLFVAVMGVVLQFYLSAMLMRGAASQRALDALTHLSTQFSDSDDVANGRAAVTVLADAYIKGGGKTQEAFDFDAAKAKLGPALPYVQEIERILREERQIYPVFTD